MVTKLVGFFEVDPRMIGRSKNSLLEAAAGFLDWGGKGAAAAEHDKNTMHDLHPKFGRRAHERAWSESVGERRRK